MSEIEKWQPTEDPSAPQPLVRVSTATQPQERTKWIVALVLAVVLTGLGVWWKFSAEPVQSDTHTRRSQDVVVAMRDLARLETTQFHIANIIEKSSDEEQGPVARAFNSSDVLLLIAEANVVAGVDLEKLRAGDVVVDETRRSVRLTLPAPEIFSASLDNRRTRVWRRETDMLAERSITLETDARLEAERTLRETAIEQGILTQAEAQARRVIRSLCLTFGFEMIEINFVTDETR